MDHSSAFPRVSYPPPSADMHANDRAQCAHGPAAYIELIPFRLDQSNESQYESLLSLLDIVDFPPKMHQSFSFQEL